MGHDVHMAERHATKLISSPCSLLAKWSSLGSNAFPLVLSTVIVNRQGKGYHCCYLAHGDSHAGVAME